MDVLFESASQLLTALEHYPRGVLFVVMALSLIVPTMVLFCLRVYDRSLRRRK